MGRIKKPLTDTPARWKAIEKKFGVTKEDYNKILQEQGGVCFICQRSPYEIRPRRHLAIDHCHKTGKIRGLLCYSCNSRLIGFLIKDDKAMAKRLYQYLSRRKHYGKIPNG